MILRHLRNHGVDLAGAHGCDLGSGFGHWIDFYLSIGAARCTGIDISEKSAELLRQKHAGDARVTIHQGRLLNTLPDSGGPFDFTSAIGVMFHLVDDGEWEKTPGPDLRTGASLISFGFLPAGDLLHLNRQI